MLITEIAALWKKKKKKEQPKQQNEQNGQFQENCPN